MGGMDVMYTIESKYDHDLYGTVSFAGEDIDQQKMLHRRGFIVNILKEAATSCSELQHFFVCHRLS